MSIPLLHPPVPTLILSVRDSVDRRQMQQAATEAGIPVHVLESWRAPEIDGDIRFYGEALLAEAVGYDLGLTVLDPPIDWLATCLDWVRGRQVIPMTASVARAGSFPMFIKGADDKLGGVPGEVYPSADSLPDVDDDTPVLVSEPVDIVSEYRLWCADGVVVAGGSYWHNGESWQIGLNQHADSDEIIFFTERVLHESPPLPPGVVIDVARCADGSLIVVEANGAWGTGIYDGTYVAGVLQVVMLASGRRDDLQHMPNEWRREPLPVER